MARPDADSVDRNTPRIAILNSPEAARYTPVVVSDEKFKDGEPTEPLFKLMVEEPARMVLALYRFTESHTSVAWLPAVKTAVAPDPVEIVTV
jgi:hypothetical protein